MTISIIELIIITTVMALIFIGVKAIQYKCYKKYWYKDEDGIFRSHFTWSQFFRDLFSGRLFK